MLRLGAHLTAVLFAFQVRPSVSYHAHSGAVKFLMPVYCGHCSLYPPPVAAETYPEDDDVIKDESFAVDSDQLTEVDAQK